MWKRKRELDMKEMKWTKATLKHICVGWSVSSSIVSLSLTTKTKRPVRMDVFTLQTSESTDLENVKTRSRGSYIYWSASQSSSRFLSLYQSLTPVMFSRKHTPIHRLVKHTTGDEEMMRRRDDCGLSLRRSHPWATETPTGLTFAVYFSVFASMGMKAYCRCKIAPMCFCLCVCS